MASIDNACKNAIEFAKELNPNVTIENGINWIWAYGFTSYSQAEEFDKYCGNNNCETRGVYSSHAKQGEERTYSVRFR